MSECPGWEELKASGHGSSNCRTWGGLSWWLTRGRDPAVSDRALVYRAAYDLGVLPRAVQVDPHVEFVGRPIGHLFFQVSREKAVLWLQN